MNFQIIDTKLKNLIQVCKESENFKKLAVVSFILTSNIVNEIGIKLGIRPRNRSSREKIFEYMEVINEVFEDNLKIPIFQMEQIKEIRTCEILFLKNKGDIPYDYIKNMFKIYYDLRKLEVPNLHQNIQGDKFLETTQMGFFSFLSPKSKQGEKSTNTLKPLILQKIKEKELRLQRNLQTNLDSQKFETAIYLNSIKNSLIHDRKGKITIQGALKDNIRYKNFIENIFGYFIIGIIILLGSLGIILLIELSIFPTYSSGLSYWSLFFFGGSVLLIIFYIKQYRKERR
ncbi:MAG: hypothetical protein ACFE9M_05230 [Promethearchaeota archaeon]